MSDDKNGNIGDNSKAKEENLRNSATIMISLAKRTNEFKKEIKGLQGDIRSVYGEGKSVGIKAKHIRFAEKFLEAEDEDVLIEDWEIQQALMQALNIDFGFQMALDLEDRRPLDDRAFAQGRADGLEGKTLNNPYNSGSQKAKFDEGYHAAQAEAREAFQRAMEAANAEKERKEAAKKAGSSKAGEGSAAPSEEEIEAAKANGTDVVSDMDKRKKKNAAIAAAASATKPPTDEAEGGVDAKPADERGGAPLH